MKAKGRDQLVTDISKAGVGLGLWLSWVCQMSMSGLLYDSSQRKSTLAMQLMAIKGGRIRNSRKIRHRWGVKGMYARLGTGRCHRLGRLIRTLDTPMVTNRNLVRLYLMFVHIKKAC